MIALLGKLEEIGYLICRKAFVGKRPKSTYTITDNGKRALANYLNATPRLINAIEESK
ncbi:MAG: transcriptional regulator [Planctomycetota bacterium]|nr:transcriptional regulator [Planctomycetota bacterium]